MKTHGIDLARTADAIDLVTFLERLGYDAQLIPLKRGTSLEVLFDEELEDVVEDWLKERQPVLASTERRT